MSALEPVATSSAEDARSMRKFPNVFRESLRQRSCSPGWQRHREGRVSIGETVTNHQDSLLWTFEEIGRLKMELNWLKKKVGLLD